MSADLPLQWGVDLTEDESVDLVVPVQLRHYPDVYLGLAVVFPYEPEAGAQRLVITEADARALHAALGTALAEGPAKYDDALPQESAVVNPTSVPKSVPGRRAEVHVVEDVVEVDDDDAALLREALLEAVDDAVDRLHLIRRIASDLKLDVRRGEDHPRDSTVTVTAMVDGDADGRVLAQKLCEGLIQGQCDGHEAVPVQVERELPDLERRLHDASPSAGESAEPGLASTLSVGEERAAGARNEEALAAAPVGRFSRSINPAALRSIRELAGVRSGDLARAAGISPPFLSNIEAGRKTPSPTVLHALAQRLGVPIDAITQAT